jgi:hypothetical protein
MTSFGIYDGDLLLFTRLARMAGWMLILNYLCRGERGGNAGKYLSSNIIIYCPCLFF